MEIAKKHLVVVSAVLAIICTLILLPSFAQAEEAETSADTLETTSTEEVSSSNNDNPSAAIDESAEDSSSTSDSDTQVDGDQTQVAVDETESTEEDAVDEGTPEAAVETPEENSQTEQTATPTPVVSELTQASSQEQSSSISTQSEITTQASQGHWYVGDLGTGAGIQRYWYDGTGALVTNRLVDPSEGSGWWAYATPFGYVVRGYFNAGNGLIYFANNDGVLADAGWVITDAYGQNLQRYYIDGRTHSAVVGFSSDGWDHYTTNQGYVLRGMASEDGNIYLADNDGRVAANGWAVLDINGYGLQRYWISDRTIATNRVITAAEAGWWAYARPEGFVVRGAFDTGHGMVYLANNDGVLEQANGWLVTGAYTNGVLQRYFIDADTHAARSGFFTVDGYGDSFGLGGAGYVLRGKVPWGDHVLLSDNDGRMITTDGWIVTDMYDGHLERYWIDICYDNHYRAAKVGYFFTGDSVGFGMGNVGYVMRNNYDYGGGHWYWTNNDGVGTIADDRFTSIERYIAWALAIANDDSHGYDQEYRWGERGDYDCSSLVISAIQVAGYNAGGATYTGNMISGFTANGWSWNGIDVSKLKRGDILLNAVQHTAIYLGEGMLVHASGNEWGGVSGGQPGDQTGTEICSRTYYDRPWDGYLRCW